MKYKLPYGEQLNRVERLRDSIAKFSVRLMKISSMEFWNTC